MNTSDTSYLQSSASTRKGDGFLTADAVAPGAKLKNAIAVGDAYQQRRDTRAIVGTLFAAAMFCGSLTTVSYASLTDRWSLATALLVVATAIAGAAAISVPWEKLSPRWQLTMFWASLAAIVAGVYIFDVATLATLLLMPMMALTYFFGRDREILVSHMIVAIGAFVLLVVTGTTVDPELALIVTLPALVAAAALAGVLADRFHMMRRSERGRYKATIEALSTALTARDGYTGSHSQETLWFVRAICDELRLTENEIEYVSDVALLHDIGKIGIPNDVLHEPGTLSLEQWQVMKQHPEIGERIVATVPGLEEVARAIRHEHERWDGGGYPDGLKGGAIPLASRIVLVCDAFHAMTSDRPYRMAMSVEEARLELAKNAGTQFDPTVVGALLHVLDARESEFFDRTEPSVSVNQLTAAVV